VYAEAGGWIEFWVLIRRDTTSFPTFDNRLEFLDGPNTPFEKSGGNCGTQLGLGEACELIIKMKVTAGGTFSDTLTLAAPQFCSMNTGKSSVTLTAKISTEADRPRPILSITNNPTIEFGDVVLGGKKTRYLFLTNSSGTVPGKAYDASQISVSLPAGWEFTGGYYPGVDGNCTKTLSYKPGENQCVLDVTYSPTEVRAYSGNIVVNYSGQPGKTYSVSYGLRGEGKLWEGCSGQSFGSSGIYRERIDLGLPNSPYALPQCGQSIAVHPDGRILIGGNSWDPTENQNFRFRPFLKAMNCRGESVDLGGDWMSRFPQLRYADSNRLSKVLVANNGTIFIFVNRYSIDNNIAYIYRMNSQNVISLFWQEHSFTIEGAVFSEDGKLIVAGRDSQRGIVHKIFNSSLALESSGTGVPGAFVGTYTVSSINLRPGISGSYLGTGKEFFGGAIKFFGWVAALSKGGSIVRFSPAGANIGEMAVGGTALTKWWAGKIFVARKTGQDLTGVTRYASNWNADTDFGNQNFTNTERINDVIIQPDGKIVVTGCGSREANGDMFVGRLKPTGQIDSAP